MSVARVTGRRVLGVGDKPQCTAFAIAPPLVSVFVFASCARGGYAWPALICRGGRGGGSVWVLLRVSRCLRVAVIIIIMMSQPLAVCRARTSFLNAMRQRGTNLRCCTSGPPW